MITYSKKRKEIAESTKAAQPSYTVDIEQRKTDRILSTLTSLGSRLKRLSMTVAEAKDTLRRRSFVAARLNGEQDLIGLGDLIKLQTTNNQQSFSSWLDSKLADNWTFSKLSESTFSEVFLASKTDLKMVVKVMPLLDGEAFQSNSEDTPIPVLPEAAFHEISALVAIRDRIKPANRFSIVDGPFPELLCQAWRDWPNETFNVSPDQIDSGKFAIVCMEDGGDSLEHYAKHLSVEQGVSVIKQVLVAMLVLERELQFEHRDLHMGNVLVKNCLIDYIQLPACPSIRTEGVVHYRDLEADQWIFEGDASVDQQYQVYRDMRELVCHDWRPFNPRTNLLWIKHITNGIIAAQPKKAKSHYLYSVLEEFRERVMGYPDLKTLIKQDAVFKRVTLIKT